MPQVSGRLASRRDFLPLCFALAFLGMVSLSYPGSAVVAVGALAAPRRWRAVTLAAALGSALGATLLMLAFQHWAWPWVYEQYPALASDGWAQRTLDWVSRYGLPALAAVAISPLPLAPALAFFAIAGPGPVAVFAIILLAKAFKYGVVAWAVSRVQARLAGVTSP